MITTVFAQKGEQKQLFDPQGKRVPVTVCKPIESYLVGIREDGDVFVLTIGFMKSKHVSKPLQGTVQKAGVQTPLRFLREVRVLKDDTISVVEENGKKVIKAGDAAVSVGDMIDPTIVFHEGNVVNVTGTSKGKGFQGGMRRHGFRGGPKTHGQSDRARAPGAIGSRTIPGRVFKGKRMAGHMGCDRVTVQKLSVVNIDDGVVVIKGLIPGPIGGLVQITSIVN